MFTGRETGHRRSVAECLGDKARETGHRMSVAECLGGKAREELSVCRTGVRRRRQFHDLTLRALCTGMRRINPVGSGLRMCPRVTGGLPVSPAIVCATVYVAIRLLSVQIVEFMDRVHV